MRVEIIYSPVEATTERLEGCTVVVIDVFRATSCICAAIENGANKLIPITTIEDSLSMRDQLTAAGERVILGGERKTIKIDGFDLDNSPRSYTAEAIGQTSVVMSTTNGTRSIQLAESCKAARVLIGSLLNARAVAEKATEGGRDIVLFCSGRHDHLTIEDVLCAGYIAQEIERHHTCFITDSAWMALDMYNRYSSNLREALHNCEHYNRITKNGLADDVAYCLQRDIFSSVPEVRSGVITK